MSSPTIGASTVLAAAASSSSAAAAAAAAARKRPRTSFETSTASSTAPKSSSSSSSSCSTCPLLTSELTALKSDLEREQSLRTLDVRRSEQAESRLRRQVQFVTEENDELRTMLDEVRSRTEEDLRKASKARRDALRRLAESERRVAELDAERDAAEDECERVGRENGRLREEAGRYKVEVEELRRQVLEQGGGGGGGGERAREEFKDEDGSDDEEDEMDGEEYQDEDDHDEEEEEEEEEVERAHVVEDDEEAEEAAAEGIGAPPSRPVGAATPARKATEQKPQLSPAPPAVMTELNRTRIKLAESERTVRQLNRRLKSVQGVADTAVRHREEAAVAKAKLERVDGELSTLRKEREAAKAMGGRWDEFAMEIAKAFHDKVEDSGGNDDDVDQAMMTDKDHAGSSSGGSGTAPPPEVATVLRKFSSLRTKLRLVTSDRDSLKTNLDSAHRQIAHLESRLGVSDAASSAWRAERSGLEDRAKKAELDLRKIRVQEGVWKREADGLRKLVETYEGLEGRMVGRSGKTGDKGGAGAGGGGDDDDGPTVRALRTSLTSAQEQVKLLTAECATLKTEAAASKSQAECASAELCTVKEKFLKLRDALYKEREKAERAEDRAAQAESLAGKGSYDAGSTRVLHLKDNPMMDAVRARYTAEIDALRKALEEKRSDAAGGTTAEGGTPLPPSSAGAAGLTPPSSGGGGADSSSSLDAQKLHRRLKESFREQIGKFREGVYLLTGYKVDMTAPSNPSDPVRYRVRSVYAEREEDHLMFSWPKVGKGEERTVTMLDLLDTEQAQLLSKSPSFEYMTKYKSLPGFMASVQLELFERQTFAG